MKYPVVFVIGVSKDSELHIHTFLLFQPCPEVFTKNWDPVVSGIEEPHRKVQLMCCIVLPVQSVINSLTNLLTLIKSTGFLIPTCF